MKDNKTFKISFLASLFVVLILTSIEFAYLVIQNQFGFNISEYQYKGVLLGILAVVIALFAYYSPELYKTKRK